MKKAIVLILLVCLSFGTSFSKERNKEPQSLGVIKGNIIPYLKEVDSYLKVKSVVQMSVSFSADQYYFLKKYKSLADFYVDIEYKAMLDLKKIAKKKCNKYPYYGLDNFEISLTRVTDILVLITATCNIVCIGYQ